MELERSRQQALYEIIVEGELDAGWTRCFSGMMFTVESRGKSPTTTLSGTVADQAALRGMLCKLWDLNLTLIAVRRIEMCSNYRGGGTE